MRYMGGKSKISKVLGNIINTIAFGNDIQNYYEPFCGGLGAGKCVNIKNHFYNDLDTGLIDMYKKIQNDGMFDYIHVTEEEYKDIRDNKYTDKYDKWFISYVNNIFSIYGLTWCGYDKIENKPLISYNGLKRDADRIIRSTLSNKSYEELEIKPGSIVYCDAPYKETAGYTANGGGRHGGGDFNFDAYYNWLIDTAKNNLVIISEYRMPKGFKEILHFRLNFGVTVVRRELSLDREDDCLYVVKGGYLVDELIELSNLYK